MGGKRRKGAGRKCRNCGTFNELDARYCGQCGNTLPGSLPERGKKKAGPRGKEPSYWMIVAIIAVMFSVGLAVKMAFYPSPDIPEVEQMDRVPLSADDPMERPRNIDKISRPSSKKETKRSFFIINDFCNIHKNIEKKSLFRQGLST